MSDRQFTPHSANTRYVLLAEIPKIIGKKTGTRPHISTIHRWVRRGINGVKLRTTFMGGHQRTTEQWLYDFWSEIKTSKDGEAPRCTTVPTRCNSSQRKRTCHQKAVEQLKSQGF